MKQQAIAILRRNCERLPFEKIVKNFGDDVEFNEELHGLFRTLFIQMNSNNNLAAITRNLSDYEVFNLEQERHATSNNFILVTGEEGSRYDDQPAMIRDSNKGIQLDTETAGSKATLCSECSKPIGL